MSVLFVTVGTALVLLALADLFSTTLSVASVNGIVSGRIADFFWRRVVQLRLSHRKMRTMGLLIVVGFVLGWATTLWVGWTLVFIGAGDAVVNTTTGIEGSIADRAFYAGYLISTLGNGDFTAQGPAWQIVSVLASLTGLISVTLAITFLVPVASGVVHRRQLATMIATLGETPEKLLERAYDGDDFSNLEPHLESLHSELQLLTQRHMAYPVLHYFHSNERHAAIAPMVAVLDESVLLLLRGTSTTGINHLTLEILRDSIAELLRLLEDAFIRPADEAPDGPELESLERLGVVTIDGGDFQELLETESPRRRVLRGFVEADGWSWDEVREPPERSRPRLGWTISHNQSR